jgi:hypothetical protein
VDEGEKETRNTYTGEDNEEVIPSWTMRQVEPRKDSEANGEPCEDLERNAHPQDRSRSIDGGELVVWKLRERTEGCGGHLDCLGARLGQ